VSLWAEKSGWFAPPLWNTLMDYFYPQLSRQDIYSTRALSYCTIPIYIK